MNLPEYRAAVRQAQNRFQNTVVEASEVLAKELMYAEGQLFEEQPLAVEPEDYADRTAERAERSERALKRLRP